VSKCTLAKKSWGTIDGTICVDTSGGTIIRMVILMGEQMSSAYKILGGKNVRGNKCLHTNFLKKGSIIYQFLLDLPETFKKVIK